MKTSEAFPYRILLSFDQDNHVWIAQYPELPGCLAHGTTREEALHKGEEMASLWLEAYRENEKALPAPLYYQDL